jgi:hypothetical protein
MAKDKDVNDILGEEGEDGVRGFHDTAEPFDESNPKFQNGNANWSHGDEQRRRRRHNSRFG